MKRNYRTIQVLGGPVVVAIYMTTSGDYCCEFAKAKNPDLRRDLQTSATGETVEVAMSAYVRQCQQLAGLPLGSLYQD